MLRKCLGDPSLITPIQVMEDLSCKEISVAILDRQIRNLQTKDIASIKVLWRNNNIEAMTWEAKEDKRVKYPHLFRDTGGNSEATIVDTTLEDQTSFARNDCNSTFKDECSEGGIMLHPTPQYSLISVASSAANQSATCLRGNTFH